MKPKILVFSDNICPFCLIGKKRLDQLKLDFNIDVEWKSFEIHPDVPATGMNMEQYFGNVYVQRIRLSLVRLAQAEHLPLVFNPILSNSHLSLKVNEFAKRQGRFDHWHQLVLEAYFYHKKNVGDPEVIFGLAKAAGFDIKQLQRYLRSTESERMLRETQELAQSMGISAVPTIVVDENLIVGAQPYEVLSSILRNFLLEKEQD